MSVQLEKRLFSVDEYHRMAEAGILSEEDRVELIEGEILTMSPIGSRHAACVKRLNTLFQKQIGAAAIVSVQDPIRLGAFSEPQPDVALLKAREDFYADAHPGADDILLVIEVAETSSAYDREVKLGLYGRSGIPEVWLVDLAGKVVEVYREPKEGIYQQVQSVSGETELRPQQLPQVVIQVAEILG